ncbi:MFS transporter [Herbaspirillum sp. RTI4]|uniref:MFS transporter n=1 Tax=Herbaspirillum sp. RTI4 TaxID=3048640 RepID=UPI002AB3BD34|nr:MFS transporter [Herbaspirillum sp. RTI4]MDY7578801.1 MFS transporter [Herbaspirillum sp. RTI4]MEA9982278.1 MFS transporter [Herbaspirillum sp. RTI4]
MSAVTQAPPTLPSSEESSPAPYWPLWLACLCGYAAIGMTIQVMPTYAHSMGAGAVAAGLAVTVGSLATMVVRPIAGRYADRHGARGIVMAGALLGLAGGIGHLLAMNLTTLILARLILGAGEGMLFTASIGAVLASAAPARRGKIAGHFGLSMWLGLAGGPIIGAAVLTVGGYQGVWLVASLLPAFAWVLLALTPRWQDSLAHGAKGTLRHAFLPRASWLPGVSNAFAGIGYGVIAAFLVPRFAALHLAGQDLALAVFGLAFILTRFVGSPWVDRFGVRPVLFIAFLCEAAGLAGLSVAGTTAAGFAFAALTGAGLSMLYPCIAAWVSKSASPHERTAALGSVTSAWDLGLALGGPLGGVVAGAWSGGPFVIGALAALIATLPLVFRSR